MKRILLLTLLSIVGVVLRAQFKLTPNDGLKTEEGAYTIKRAQSELENYRAAMKVVKEIVPNAAIEEPEFEKVFTVRAETVIKMKVAGMFKAVNWTAEYMLKIEAAENEIIVSFEKLGNFEHRKKNGTVDAIIRPYTGHNSFWNQTFNSEYSLFNSSGDLKAPKAAAAIESWANCLVRQIEESLK